MPTAKANTAANTPQPRGLSVVAWACLLMVVVGAVASVGTSTGADTATNLLAVLDTWLRAAWAPALFMLASYGLGRVFDRWIGGSTERRAIRLTLGLAVSLTVVHGLGVLGLLSPATSIGLVAVGLFLLLTPSVRAIEWKSVPRVGAWSVLLLVPIGIGLVASASPPGWLWGSEFGGYDALSYHLSLPQEWLRAGRVWPVEHNVYSFLPSYLETVSVFFSHLTLAPIDSANGHGLTAGSGWRAAMPQVLHFMITLCAAWAVGRVAAAVVRATGEPGPADEPAAGETAEHTGRDDRLEQAATLAAWVAGLLTLATPWVLVVGTLAYNEMAVVLLGAGAMLVALDHRGGPRARGVLCAVLVGVACGCKPTALLFVAPPVGLVLLMRVPRSQWLPVIVLGVLAGVLTLSPWLVRNQIATGNPVFPAMTGTLGPGHYTTDQVARYAGAHEYDGSVIDRVRLLVWADPAAAIDSPMVGRFRGLGNPQWFVLAPFGLLGLGMLAARPGTRRAAAWLGLGLLLQLIAWAAFTHLQSRFLLPCVLTLCPAIGVALALSVRSRAAAAWVGVLVVLAQTSATAVLFAQQHHQRGGPNLRLASGTAIDTGRPADPAVIATVPSAYINTQLPADSVVYLLGDATPFYYERRVVYNTTYDAWPLGEAITADPGSPDAWTESLRALGITHVLVSPGELGRLTGSGWIDPAITPARMVEWLQTLPPPIMAWPAGSAPPVRVLYRLDHAPPTAPPTVPPTESPSP
ncbi:MAG: hypothetical protein ACI89L_002528 [Phycisphaerales bacterium]|jgi:hypothetical protein